MQKTKLGAVVSPTFKNVKIGVNHIDETFLLEILPFDAISCQGMASFSFLPFISIFHLWSFFVHFHVYVSGK
jgi:hypothetical protein